MSTLVSEIIDGGFNRSTRNDPGKLAQDPECLAHLNRIYNRSWALIARARPDEFQSEFTITMTGTPPTGAIPPDTIAVLGCYDASGSLVTIGPSTDRTRAYYQYVPFVWRSGNSLVSRNQLSDPATGDQLTLLILDAPAPIVATSQLLDVRWPIRQVQLLVDAMAMYFDVKDAGREPVEHSKLQSDTAPSLQAFAAEYGLPPGDMSWIHAPVERANG